MIDWEIRFYVAAAIFIKLWQLYKEKKLLM